MSDGFKSATLRDQIQPRDNGLDAWAKLLKAQQGKDAEICPMKTGDWACEWSIKYRQQGAVWCHGRYYRDCSVWKQVQANGGDPSVLIQ